MVVLPSCSRCGQTARRVIGTPSVLTLHITTPDDHGDRAEETRFELGMVVRFPVPSALAPLAVGLPVVRRARSRVPRHQRMTVFIPLRRIRMLLLLLL